MAPDEDAEGLGGKHRVAVPGAASLGVGQSRTFSYERGGKSYEGFLLRHESGFFAFANACPHWNVDLDLGFGDFYDPVMDRIFCKNHGALFLPATGECTAGPCAGQFLEQFDVELEGEDARVNTAPLVSLKNLLRRE